MQSRVNRGGSTEEESKSKSKTEEDLQKINWEVALERALKRGLGECVICMGVNSTSTRSVELLNCSHAFHTNCVRSLEKYANENGPLQCPVCRNPYTRRQLDVTCTKFLHK
jgi:hypothetical protein